jgi:uncharacterized protein
MTRNNDVMALTVNLRHLDDHDIHLKGELSVEELDINTHDEIVQVKQPLSYDFQAQKLETGVLLQGQLGLTLDCECVRCLKEFEYRLELANWTEMLPFEGEESVAVVNDCVDLTPYIREDILLELPQHPLCKPDCRGLPNSIQGKSQKAGAGGQTEGDESAWSALDKLKL